MFQRAVDLDKGNSRAHLRLGEILLAAGSLDRATENAWAVLQAGKTDADALALLGAASALTGQSRIAEEAFLRVLDNDPGRVPVAVALAELYSQQDRVQEARVVLNKAAESRPGSALPMLALGRLEEQEGNTTAAEQDYREAVSREDTPETNLRLAQFLQRASRVAEVEAVLRHIDHMQPGQPTSLPDFRLLAGNPRPALRDYVSVLGRTAQAAPKGKAESAKQDVMVARVIEAQLASTEQPERHQSVRGAQAMLNSYRPLMDPAAVSMLQAEIALVEDNLPEAATHARNALGLTPKSPTALYLSGAVKYQYGDTLGAVQAWREALEQQDGYLPARLALTRESLLRGDLGPAEDYVLPAVRQEPGNLYALTLYSEVLLLRRRYQEAEGIATRAAMLASTAPSPRVLLARIAEAQQRLPEALLQFERALVLDPEDSTAMEGVVRIYRRGRVTRAMLANIESLAAVQPASAPLWEIAGRLYADKGWFADARRCLQQALRISPQRHSAAKALSALGLREGDLNAAVGFAIQSGGRKAALLAGLLAERHNDLHGAVVQYEAALRRGDPTGIAANNLAWLYAESDGDLNRALLLAQQARQLAPDDPAVLDTVGVVHLRRREYTEAIAVLNGAAQLLAVSPRQPDLLRQVREHLLEARWRAGLSK
jgi:tetratricopeptide (TPR) repeat protein